MPAWEDVSPYTEQRTRSHRFSWTNVLIVLNLAGFVVTGILLKSNSDALSFFQFDQASAIGRLQLWQFVSYTFVQPLEPLYIPWLILGVVVLFTIGNDLESELGAGRYLALYFSCAAYGALAHALLQATVPALAPGFPAGPAATLCAPVLGIAQTAALRWPRRPVLFLLFIPMRLRTAMIVLGLAWLPCAQWGMGQSGQGMATSLGAVVAALAIAALEPRIDLAFDRSSQRRERDRFLEEVDVRRRTDGILEKITRSGLASLTRAERRTLKMASQILNRGKGRPHE